MRGTVGKLVSFPIPPGGEGANIKFACLNGRCVPANAIPSDAFNNTAGEDDMDIETCLVKCNMIVHSVNNRDVSLNLLDAVKKMTARDAILPEMKRRLTNSGPMTLALVVAGLLLGAFFCGIFGMDPEEEK